MEFKKKIQVDLSCDKYYNTISSILAFTNNIKPIGSFALHCDYKKVCDLDLQERICIDNSDFFIKFKSYVEKLKKGLKDNNIYFIKAYFDIPYMPLKTIMDNMGYVDGNLELHMKEFLTDKINKLPDELKNNINILINRYKKTKDINDYLNITKYINSKINIKWTLNELYSGEKTYYDTKIRLDESNFTNFYIEVIYNDFRVSNFIYINSGMKYNVPHQITFADDIMLNDNISYYRLLKKFKVFIKWLVYTNKITDNIMKESTMILYNEISDILETISEDYNKYCILMNKIDIMTIKINKYNKKIKKNNKEAKYHKLHGKYTKKQDKYNMKYHNNIIRLEEKYKDKFLSYIKNDMYTQYLEQYFRII